VCGVEFGRWYDVVDFGGADYSVECFVEEFFGCSYCLYNVGFFCYVVDDCFNV